MTRHQIWKARERARFLAIALKAKQKRGTLSKVELTRAFGPILTAYKEAKRRGITEPFLG